MWKFALHPLDGGLEEEGDEMLVGAFGADLFEDGDVSTTILQFDDQQGMISPAAISSMVNTSEKVVTL